MNGIMGTRFKTGAIIFLVLALFSQSGFSQQTFVTPDRRATYAEAMSACSELYDQALALSGKLTEVSGEPGTMAVWVLQPETEYCHVTDLTHEEGFITYKNIQFYTLHKAFLNGEWVYAGGLPIAFGQFWYVSGTEHPVEATAPSCGVSVGNPIDVLTGNKYESVDDILAGSGGISFQRHYSSAISAHHRRLGRGWTYTFSSEIHSSPFDDSLVLLDDRGFGSIYKRQSGSNLFSNENGETIERIDVGGEVDRYLHTPRAGAVLNEVYGSKGQLLSRRTASEQYTLSYNVGQHSYLTDSTISLASVTNDRGRRLYFSYDSEGLLASVSDSSGQTVSFSYDPGPVQRLLKSITYSDGHGYQYAYDRYRLVKIADEAGNALSNFGYDYFSTNFGRATSTSKVGGLYKFDISREYFDGSLKEGRYEVRNSGGVINRIKYRYVAGLPRPVDFLNPCSGYRPVKSIGYRDDGLISSETDFNGRTDSYQYDAVGRRTSSTEADGSAYVRKTEEDWHASLQVPIERRKYNAENALLAKSTWTYNSRSQVLATSQIDPVSGATRATTKTYCEQANVTAGTCPLVSLMTSVKGPRSDLDDTTIYTYYPSDHSTCVTAPASCPHRKGDLWKVTNALGRVIETLAYDGAGRPLSVKDPNGVITDYEYHPRGWLTATKVRGTDSSTESDDRITRIDYWPTGLVKRVTQPDGAVTAYTYDAAHRLTDVSDNAGNTIHYTLDNAGNRIAEDTKDANGNLKRTLSRVYNQLGQLVTQADAVGNPTDYGYDANGNTTSATDALSRVTQSEYDPLNRLKRTLQDVGGIAAETKFAYDALDNLTEVTDPKGLKTTYTYNGLGDLTKRVSPDTGTTLFTYDSAGNRITQKDARNKTTSYSYDALNRLTGVAYATTTSNVSYIYDANQSVCTATESFSVGRLTKMQDGSGTTQYCYNRFGDLTRKVQTVNGVALTLRYSYAPGGQLTAMTYPDGAVVDYVRDSQGRITEVGVKPSAGARQVLLTGASYHPFGPVAGWTYGNGRQMTRTLDLDYRPAAIHDASTGGLAVGFNYDEVGNLVELTQPGSTLPQVGFGYDALGRLIQFKDGPTGTVIDSYGYDKTGNRTSLTTAAGTSTYSYPTTSHRLTNVGGIARTYDAAGNTTGINGTAKQFVYDDTGRMSSVKAGGTTTRNYKYNDKGERVRSYLSTANTYTLYDEAGHWIGDYGANGTPVQQAIWMDDLPVGLRAAAAGTVSYIEPDHLGSPRVVIDPVANTAIWKWDIKGEAFGATAPEQDPDGNGTALNLDMRFLGQRYDAYTGLSYNYFRDYDPGIGRYAQSDPLGVEDGPATYAYVKNKPTATYDPFGLATFIGFPPDKKAAMEAAVQSAIKTLRNCKCGCAAPGSAYCFDDFDRQAVMSLLNGLTYYYKPQPTNSPYAAAERVVLDVWVYPEAFSRRACPLPSTLAHEANHLNAKGHRSEEGSYYLEDLCFNCKHYGSPQQ